MDTKIFKCDKLPFLELRYVSQVSSCEKKHTHETLTLTAIKQGVINLFLTNKTELLKPNTNAIINPYQAHRAEITQYESKDGFCFISTHNGVKVFNDHYQKILRSSYHLMHH